MKKMEINLNLNLKTRVASGEKKESLLTSFISAYEKLLGNLKLYNSNKPETEQLNAYDLAVLLVKEKVYPENVTMEKHHIIPKYREGGNNAENLLCVSYEDHTFLHYVRYQVFRENGDQCAFAFRLNQHGPSIEEVKELARAARKASKKGWNDPETQRKLGLKGGLKGGSANTETQFNARRQVGLTYGSIIGMQNQSTGLKEFISKPSTWLFRDAEKKIEAQVEIGPAASFTALVKELQKQMPESPAINSSCFTKLAKGERKQLYGWSLVSTPIRSEAKKGS